MWQVTQLILCFVGFALLAFCINFTRDFHAWETDKMARVKRPRDKFYVTLGWRKLVINEKSPIDACVAMLARRFKNADSIPDSFWQGEAFTVSMAGFRPINGVQLETEAGIPYVDFADHVLPTTEVVDYFARLETIYDPFCETDEYFQELGEDDE